MYTGSLGFFFFSFFFFLFVACCLTLWQKPLEKNNRIIAAWYLVGQDQGFPQPGSGVPKKVHEAHNVVDAREPRDRPTLLQGAVEGHVLVKNEGNVLPLRSPRTVSVFGYSANTAAKYSLAEDTDGSWSWGGAPVLGVSGPRLYAPKGTLYSGGGAGAISPAAVTSPLEALQARAQAAGGGFRLLQDLTSDRPRVDPASDACLVFGNAWATEGAERAGLADDYTDTLVRAVADQCPNTVVVLHNAGVRVVDGFVDHPNVKALVFAHLPGQESGHALVSLLFGDVAPSGKLPYTVARREADYGPRLEHVTGGVDTYADGVYTDYKYFEARGIEPRYEFGFGLSYTRFDYAALAVDRRTGSSTGEWPSGRVVPGGQEDLFDTVATVSFALTNAGPRDGAEAAQLYVRIPGVRAKQLRGFAKRFLRRGETARLSLDLTRRDLSVWNTQAQRWQLQRGRYEILVGASSRQLPLVATLTI